MANTPYDIKPYIPYVDCHTEAAEGYDRHPDRLRVILPDELGVGLTAEQREALRGVLALLPLPFRLRLRRR